jgi:hypothetical protein
MQILRERHRHFCFTLNHYTQIGKEEGVLTPDCATVPAQSTPLGKNDSLLSMVGFSHCFGRVVWNRGESNRGVSGEEEQV